MTLRDTTAFERDVVRALWAGAAAGALHALALGLLGASRLPVWPFVGTAVLLAFGAGSANGRTVLVLASLLAPIAGLTSSGFASALLTGAVTGGALCWARRLDGLEDRYGARALGGLALGGVLGVAAEAVAQVFALRLGGLGVPDLVTSPLLCAAAALFLALGAVPALLVLVPDLVGERSRRLVVSAEDPRLRSLVARTVEAHRGCVALLGALPRDEGRAELLRSVGALAAGTLEQAERLAGLTPRKEETDREETAAAEVRRLEAEHEASGDPVARQHLAVALEVARDGLTRAKGAAVERSRLWARLEAEAALLLRTRTTLEDVKGGHAAVRAAELTALSRRLDALGRREAMEADVLAEVALGAELDQLAAQTVRTAR